MKADTRSFRPILSDQVLLVVFGVGFRSMADLALAIALARLLSQTDFGTYRQIFLLYGIVLTMANLGLPSSLSYFIPRASSAGARSLVYRTFLLLVALSVSVVSLVLVLREPVATAMNNPALRQLLVVGALYPVCQTLTLSLPNVLVALNRHKAAGGFHLAVAAVQTFSVVVPAVLGVGLEGIVASATAAAVLNLVLALAISRRLLGGFRAGVAAPRLREQLGYSFPLGVNAMASSLYQRLDRFLVSFFYPPAVLAVYSVGAAELPLVSVLPYTVGRTLIPHFVRLGREGRRSEILQIWHRSIVKVSLALLPICALCFVFAPQIMGLVFGPSFREASSVFRVYLLLLPLRPTSYGAMLQALGDTRTVLRGGLLALGINATLGLALIPFFGWLGPAIGAVLAQVFLIIYYLRRIACVLDMTLPAVWPWRRYLLAVLVTVVSTAAALPLMWLPLCFALRTGACILAFLLAHVVLLRSLRFIGREEWELLRRWLSFAVLRSQ